MKRFRFFVVAALAAIILGSIAAYWLNPPSKLSVIKGDFEAPQPGDDRPHVQGLTYTHVKNDQRKWSLSADGARYNQDNGIITLYNVHVVFYGEDGSETSIRGDEGDFDQQEKSVFLRGNVQGRTGDDLNLASDDFRYSEKDEIAETDSWVTITGPRFSVAGQGMLVMVPQNKVIFKDQVECSFLPSGTGPPPGVTMD